MDKAVLPRLGWFLLLAVAGTTADLWTKDWIFSRLGVPPREVITIWPRVFEFYTHLNEGALFGAGQGFALFFAAMAVLAMFGIGFWLFRFQGLQSLWITTALGLVTGGILGNLYDRIGLHGLKWWWPERQGEPVYAVRDWLHFCLRDGQDQTIFDWPIFNLADCWLVIGACMIFLYSFYTPKSEQSKSEKSI